MYQCECGSASCGDCARRLPALRRDAAYTFRALADKPDYGIFMGLLWGGLFLLGTAIAVVDRVPSRYWPAIGAGTGAVVALFAAVTVLSLWYGRREAAKEGMK